MAKAKVYGLDEYSKLISQASKEVEHIVDTSIYAGANIIADSIKDGIRGLRTSGRSEWETRKREKQKQGLIESFGIAKMQDDHGFRNVKIGFDGYNEVKTKSFPNGQPNVMVARIFNSGTSFSSKQPFFDKAIRATRSTAKQKMIEVAEKELEKIAKEKE